MDPSKESFCSQETKHDAYKVYISPQASSVLMLFLVLTTAV